MDYVYFLAGVMASLVSSVLLHRLPRQMKTGAARMSLRDESLTMYKNGVRQSKKAMDTEIIIVGAGVAGSALAYALGKDGRRVRVIERSMTEPDRIVGEVLQPGAYLKLKKLDLEDCVEGIDAQRLSGYTIYKDGEKTQLSYPSECFPSNVTGRSFHNGRFIQKMREKAASLPNVTLEQGTVTSLLEVQGTIRGVHYKTKAGEELTAFAPLTVVCDGCFSNLRRFLCNTQVDTPSHFVALILENCELPFTDHACIILSNPSLVLLYRISSSEIRYLVDVPGQKLPSISNGEMAQYLKNVVASQIPAEMYNAFISSIDKGHIRTMPSRSMSTARNSIPGALLLGDALNMRHPITGGGMLVALSDVVILRDLLRPLSDLSNVDAIHKYLEPFYTIRKPMASTMNFLADFLYKVLGASPDPVKNEMQQLCFDYVSLGGVFLTGPVAVFSGINAHPSSLFLCIFVIATYSIGRMISPFPTPARVRSAARLILVLSEIIVPIMKAEGYLTDLLPFHFKTS